MVKRDADTEGELGRATRSSAVVVWKLKSIFASNQFLRSWSEYFPAEVRECLVSRVVVENF